MKRLLFGMVLLIFMATPLSAATVTGDINNDGKVGLEEAVYALQCVAGIKNNIPTQKEIDEIEYVVNYAAASAADTVDTVYAADQMDDVLAYMGLSDADGESALTIAIALATGEFDCGDMVREGTIVTYTFSGDPECGSITGQVAVTPQISDGKISFNIVYTNVVQGDCTINGSGTTVVTADGQNLIFSHQSDNMTVCGQQMDGTTTVTINAITGVLISAQVQGTYSYDDGEIQTTTVVNLTYNGSAGELDGTATITTGGKTYNCTFTDVVIDPTCGIPTAGTIAIDEYAFDFSDTTCENPTVTTTIHGIPVTMDLDDAMALYDAV